MKSRTGGVTAAKGFEAAGAEAGIKYKNRKDMALIYSKKPCVLAGTFTSNVVKAAPVKWDQNVVEHSEFGQAVVVNAGIANACTGKEGMAYCSQTAKKGPVLWTGSFLIYRKRYPKIIYGGFNHGIKQKIS